MTATGDPVQHANQHADTSKLLRNTKPDLPARLMFGVKQTVDECKTIGLSESSLEVRIPGLGSDACWVAID